MSFQTVTIKLPNHIYRQLTWRSEQTKRPVADEAAQLVASALPNEDELSSDLAVEIEQLQELSDNELREIAQLKAVSADEALMQHLVEKQQRDTLTSDEMETAQALSQRFNRIMLLRANASLILKKRGNIQIIPPYRQ